MPYKHQPNHCLSYLNFLLGPVLWLYSLMKTMGIFSSGEQVVSRTLEVTNKMGIHARPAAMIVRIANKYNDTEVMVLKDTEEVNGKSIMGLMMLAARQGSRLVFSAQGPNADTVLDQIEALFKRKFEEP